MLQHFLLTLDCGHYYQVSAVLTVDGHPYKPNYVGQTIVSKCCHKSSQCVTQEPRTDVYGQPHQTPPDVQARNSGR